MNLYPPTGKVKKRESGRKPERGAMYVHGQWRMNIRYKAGPERGRTHSFSLLALSVLRSGPIETLLPETSFPASPGSYSSSSPSRGLVGSSGCSSHIAMRMVLVDNRTKALDFTRYKLLYFLFINTDVQQRGEGSEEQCMSDRLGVIICVFFVFVPCPLPPMPSDSSGWQ